MIKDNGIKIPVNSLPFILYVSLYLLLGLLPSVEYSVPYVIAGLFAMLPMIVASLRNGRYTMILLCLIGLGMIQGLIAAFLGNGAITEIVNEPIRSIRYFVPCVLFGRLSKESRGMQKYVWVFITAIILFVAITTLAAVETNPLIARILANGSLDAELTAYRMQNIGGFGICYAVALTYAAWTYIAFHSRGTKKVIAIAAIIFEFVFAVQVQYMTMLLLCILAFLLVILFCSDNKLLKVLSVMIVIVSLAFLPFFLRWIAQMDVGAQIQSKLIHFAEALDGSRAFSQITSRVELYKDALLDFLSSPIWGTRNSVAAGTSHSTFLGIAAATGILGLASLIYGIVQCYKETARNLLGMDMNMTSFKISFAVFMVLAVVNPVHYIYEISIVMFLYVPLTLKLFLHEEEKLK